MTKEEAIDRIQQHMQRHGIDRFPGTDLTDALNMAIEALRCEKCDQNETKDHFRDLTKMIPLTLEQLREMDGLPVWVERNEAPHDGKWFIVDHADVENPDKTLYTKEGVTYSDYGTYFTAYAYPPAHIDREAWTAEWIKRDGYTECSKCERWYDSPESEDDGDRPVFCPCCGRAMMPKAWAELEKRMGGCKE